MAKTTHFKGFSIIAGDLKVKLSLSRFDEQYKKAQYQLDGDVMNSMVPFMPMIVGWIIYRIYTCGKCNGARLWPGLCSTCSARSLSL